MRSIAMKLHQTIIPIWVCLFICIKPVFSQTDTLTLIHKVGFTSLFSANNYNPEKPYFSQLSSKAVPFVQEYIRKQGAELEKMKQWGRPYFDLYNQILPQYGIPKELKYLSVIESHLRSSLRSWAGAVGPWQLMDYEAKRFGLQVGNGVDERMNYVKSTHAAAKLLKELYNQFGDWLLVVAAYNGGAGRVKQAIQRSGSQDFWDLQVYLKEETRMHVKKFIGTHYIFEGGGGITTLTKAEVNKIRANNSTTSSVALKDTTDINTITVDVCGRYKVKVLCAVLQLNEALFNQWNPLFETQLAKGEHYLMHLPDNYAAIFNQNREIILLKSVQSLLQNTNEN